ncbi:sulfotransferase family 2 domain-containing protein [uncultured Paraglaciecola sp.]|uniref:sulfotransferase family 2 domain-containing protein n=1 Tax=uncultured Paraglaciecola sp. TaxID=1765024 RepID=UPI002606B890|nr:sulfotransferase family 2 domain-containing protein [uncultured Paraglaciecola sp.]
MQEKQQPIFIHIPKTGGTSINCVIKGTEWQTPLDYYYRHLEFETKTSTCGDIFDRANREKYKQEFIFMMLRHPVDRLISEYYYIRKNPEFMGFLTTHPNSFAEYISNPQTSNYMLKFLDGQRIYSESALTSKRATEIISLIDELDMHVGIFEEYDRSLSYFSEVGDFTWPQTIDVKRATINRPSVKQISSEVVDKILAANELDLQLYQHCKAKLIERTQQLSINKIKYQGGKLDFVIPYTVWNCILDIELSNRRFIEENKTFFVTLNLYLHKTTGSGKEYAKNWVKLFKKSVAEYFKGTKFAKQIKQIRRPSAIDEIIAIARVIDAATSNPALGLELGQPKIKLLLTSQMGKVLQQKDVVVKGVINW